MERWEYIEIRFSEEHSSLYIYPEDKIDTTKIKQVFKDRAKFEIQKEANSVYLYFGHHGRERSSFMLTLTILGQSGWEAFSTSESESHQSVFLKRRIEK